ncbi:PilW family protein [Diaphorobacter aerolatus]|uniref:PilW family protein n=1 Tax=Diaphorobacter aerolatus TaxID=1288495 RepID=A0A7H0GFS9_9BURK|nr:PilW family protein [Diaphorobacter aerolatus]QNP47145.1 PilW family protein [Diaphorobacter aerolatus]
MTLLELMVGLAIGLFMLAGLTTLYLNAKTSFNNQSGLADLQKSRRVAINSLSNAIRSAGYFVDPLTTTRASVFGSSGSFAAGQFITGSDGASGASDTISIRFETQPHDALVDCLGGVNTGAAKSVMLNTLTVNAQGELTCSSGDGQAPVVLVSGIARMELRYSVDTDGDGQPDTYLPASALTTAAMWSGVHAVRARLTFRDPVTRPASGGTASSLPVLVHIIPLMNHT